MVKSKSAAIQYETRICELYEAGANVGDYGHSRKLFNDMIKVACAYVDKKTKNFINTPLPSTGMPPHFYVTADKSTNHRVTNQATMICPVVDGNRQAIPLNISSVYYTSVGETGKGEALAAAIIKDLEVHAGIKGEKIMQMQGKCTDGQYLNSPFETAMKKPIIEEIERYEKASGNDITGEVSSSFWWPLQWDPGHWLDKVFGEYKDTPFVGRVLKRTALYHQLFGHGKLHSVACETAKELKLPFRVTNAFAHQRFMSSSYSSLQNLATSLEVYIETYKDHENREDIGYKLYGQDFCMDLCGMLDVLWPLVILMLEGQAGWVPGWKFAHYIPRVTEQLEKIRLELGMAEPSSEICPWLGSRVDEIRNFKFGNSDLEVGWLVVEDKEDQSVKWEAREIEDCVKDLQDLTGKLLNKLNERYESSFSELNVLLSECLDFGVLITGLCGKRDGQSHPVSKKKFSQLGLEAFKRCVRFVSCLPHIIERNFELTEDFAFTIFWNLKSALIEVVWGSLFRTHFPILFREVHTAGERKGEIRVIDKQFSGDAHVVEFRTFTPSVFTLADIFEVTMSNGEKMVVALEERAVIESLYTDDTILRLLGKNFALCLTLCMPRQELRQW